jgi:hypothetical protein
VACADCRTRLAEHEGIQRRIHYRVIAHRNHAVPASRLAYAAIAPRVKRPDRVARFGHWLNDFVSGSLAVAALLALVILLIGMFSGARQATVNPQPTLTPTAVPVTPMPPELVWKIEGTLERPSGITLDNRGNLYVFDSGNDRVLKYDRDGQFLTQWGSTGRGDGQFYSSGLDSGIASDAQGNVYVADIGNYRIQKFDSNGKFLLKWGISIGQFTSPNGQPLTARQCLCGRSDQARVQKFDSDGKFLLQCKESRPAGLLPHRLSPSTVRISSILWIGAMERSRYSIAAGSSQPDGR